MGSFSSLSSPNGGDEQDQTSVLACSISARFRFDDAPERGPAKPSGLGWCLPLTAPPSRPSCSSNMRKRHSSHDQQPSAAEASVKAARPLRVHRSAAQSLDGRRSGEYSRHRCLPLCFQHLHAQQPPRYRAGNREQHDSPQLPHSTHVHPQQPINASVFAASGCRPFIPCTFPHSNFRLLWSTHSGVTCPYHSDAP
jgi:hypothetical protein